MEIAPDLQGIVMAEKSEILVHLLETIFGVAFYISRSKHLTHLGLYKTPA